MCLRSLAVLVFVAASVVSGPSRADSDDKKNKTEKVFVANTVKDPVPTIAQGTTQVTGNVGIAGTPNVNIAGTPNVNIVSMPPVNVQVQAPAPSNGVQFYENINSDQNGSHASALIPAGKRLHITHLSANGYAAKGANLIVTFGIGPYQSGVAINSQIPMINFGAYSSQDYFAGALTGTLDVEAGQRMICEIASNSNLAYNVSCNISGRLMDAN